MPQVRRFDSSLCNIHTANKHKLLMFSSIENTYSKIRQRNTQTSRTCFDKLFFQSRLIIDWDQISSRSSLTLALTSFYIVHQLVPTDNVFLSATINLVFNYVARIILEQLYLNLKVNIKDQTLMQSKLLPIETQSDSFWIRGCTWLQLMFG